jgi:sugar/nucleoside kinase (ribokinase family)
VVVKNEVAKERVSMASSYDCLCAGIIVADTVCHPIPKMPPSGGLAKTERVEFSIGGCSANIAVDLARLGITSTLSGRVGDDLFGREVRQRLAVSGVDISQLEISPTAPTSSTFVLNVAGEDRRFIHCVGANGEYDGMQVTEAAIRQARLLYVGGFCLLDSLTPDRVIRLFRIARENGVATVLNVVLSETTDTMAWLHPVLPWTDYFFTNDDEARRITNATGIVRQAEALRDLGTKTAIVTQGERGAILVSPEARLKAGIFPVDTIDPTGTGDAFSAGFLFGVLRGESPERCLVLGTAMGASCVRSMGATTGVFNATELAEFVRANPLAIESF